MKNLISCIALALFLSACSGGSGGDSSQAPSSSVTVSNGSAVDQDLVAAQAKISAVNAELNGSQTYQLSKEELDLLLSENSISQKEYSELLALLK